MTLYMMCNDNSVNLRCKLVDDASYTFCEADMSDLSEETKNKIEQAEQITMKEALAIGYTHMVFVWVNY